MILIVTIVCSQQHYAHLVQGKLEENQNVLQNNQYLIRKRSMTQLYEKNM